MGISPARISGLRACLARFQAEECGTGTVFALFMLFVVLMLGGLAVDGNNLWRYNEIMKSAADVAAHAGAVALAEGDSAEAAEAAARKALELNMPERRYGRILAQPYRDVRAVHYDAESGTLTPGAAANAVMVRVSRDAATHNPIPTMLLRLGGFTGWNLSEESLAVVVPTERCRSNDGIYAGGVLIPGPGLIVGPGYCLHSQQKVVPNPGSRFARTAGLSMPDLARCGEICRDQTSDGVGQAGFEANLIRGDLPGMIGIIEAGFADPRHPGPGETNFFAARPMPADRQMLMPLNEVGVSLKGLATGRVVSLSPMAFTRMRAVPQGLVYQVLCSPGPDGKLPLGAESGTLTLGGGMQTDLYRNMVLITDCSLDIGAGAEVQGALIISTHIGPGVTVTADPSARIGAPAGSCGPATRTTIMAPGSIVLPAGVMSANVGLVTGGDIRIAAAPASGPVTYGLIGVGMHAAGAVSLAVPHDLEACPGKADAFTPAIEVIRQVLPVTG